MPVNSHRKAYFWRSCSVLPDPFWLDQFCRNVRLRRPGLRLVVWDNHLGLVSEITRVIPWNIIRERPPKISTSPDSNSTFLALNKSRCCPYANSAESPIEKDTTGHPFRKLSALSSLSCITQHNMVCKLQSSNFHSASNLKPKALRWMTPLRYQMNHKRQPVWNSSSSTFSNKCFHCSSWHLLLNSSRHVQSRGHTWCIPRFPLCS